MIRSSTSSLSRFTKRCAVCQLFFIQSEALFVFSREVLMWTAAKNLLDSVKASCIVCAGSCRPMSAPYWLMARAFKKLQERPKLDYELRFFRCRGCVAELHRETTDYYTTSFSDSRKIQSHGIFPQHFLRAARGREYTLYNTSLNIFFAARRLE